MSLLQDILARASRPTKQNWLTASAVLGLFGMVAAFGTVPIEDVATPLPPAREVIQTLSLPKLQVEAAQVDGPFWQEERFQRGDTVADLLERLGVDDSDAQRVLSGTRDKQPFRSLRPGISVQAQVDGQGFLQALWFLNPQEQMIRIERRASTGVEQFSVAQEATQLGRDIVTKSGEIRSSLFAATDAVGLPDHVAMQIAEIFSGDIDFHRDLRKGDRFSVVFEQFHQAGRFVRTGRVLAVEFINGKRSLQAVWFEGADNNKGYFSPDGKNLRKAFLRSPLEFSRVTSSFGMRQHPIMQSWRAHMGVDYGAPKGTRVRATADGVVDSVGMQGGYGNMVVLRHPGGITTAYAHLSGFAAGVRKGARIAQGETVGFVGQTGWATGPHLHYEFRVNNQHRNPLTIALPAAQPLGEREMAAFRQGTGALVARLEQLRETRIAMLE